MAEVGGNKLPSREPVVHEVRSRLPPAPAKAIKGERVFYARWTSAERGRVAQLYKAGTPLHDIAAVIGRTERAVCAMATRLRVEGAL